MISKRIILLTQWFDPEPTFKGLLFAKELKKRGFEVEVVTGFPNYPGGEVYDGYSIRWIQKEVIDGVNVTRLALYPSHDASAKKRICNYVSFAFTSLLYCLFGAQKPDVIYAYHPPLTIGVIASLARFVRRIPFVYDIQDMWPDTLKATGMINNDRLLNMIGELAKWVYRQADHIVVLSPGFKRLLVDRGVVESKITVIPNWCDEKALVESKGQLHPDFPRDNRFKVLFAGNMGKAQALDLVIGSAKALQVQRSEVVFVMVGGGVDVDRLKSLVAENDLNNILFLPPVPMREIGCYLKKADALLVSLKKDELFNVTIPSKTQAYMSVGKPILMGVGGDAAEIIRSAEAGLVFEQESVSSFLVAIQTLVSKSPEELEKIGENAKYYYARHLSLQSGVDAFVEVFDQFTAKTV